MQQHSGIIIDETNQNSVLIYEPDSCFIGINAVVGAHLFDMQGKLVKTNEGVLGVFYSDSEYIAKDLTGGISLFHADNKIWNLPLEVHHEITFDNDSNILFLSEELKDETSEEGIFDILYTIDKKGNILNKQSFELLVSQIQKYLPENRDSIVLRNTLFRDQFAFPRTKFDSSYFHINSVQVLTSNPLEYKNPAFARGNLLISDFKNNFMAILDAKSFKILWFYFQKESIMGQHGARMLPNGNILFFLNNIPHPYFSGSYYSSVRIIDPIDSEIVWEFNGEKPYSLHSLSQGYCQYLKNGNILITNNNFVVGDAPYVLEITPSKTVVWKWQPANLPESNLSQRERFYRVERIDLK